MKKNKKSYLYHKTETRGFGILDVMLATILFAGLVTLIASVFSNHKKIAAAESLGVQLTTAIEALIAAEPQGGSVNAVQDADGQVVGAEYTYAQPVSGVFACAGNSSAVVQSLSDDYLDALAEQGFNLCNATVSVTTSFSS